MRNTYFVVMFFLAFVLLVVAVFFLDKWIGAVSGRAVMYFVAQKDLLAKPFVVFEASMGLGMIVYLVMHLIRERYNPQGANPSQTHIWVYRDTGQKFGDVSEFQMYEREHGAGSWQKKVEQERKGFIWIGFFVAAVLELGLLALTGGFSGNIFPLAILALLIGYFLSAGIHSLAIFLTDKFEYEETIFGDLMVAFGACLYLVMVFLVVFFLYLFVFIFIPNAPGWMNNVFLGFHGAFVIFLVGLAVLWPFMPVYLQLKGMK